MSAGAIVCFVLSLAAAAMFVVWLVIGGIAVRAGGRGPRA